MSYSYRAELAAVVSQSLAFTSKDVIEAKKGGTANFRRPTVDERILESLEDFEDDEGLERSPSRCGACKKKKSMSLSPLVSTDQK